MVHGKQISGFSLTVLVGMGAGIVYAQSPVPRVETIVARMAEARMENRARLRPYRVTRDYKLFDKEKQATKSEVVADVSFIPPDFKRYVIQHASGTRFGEKIVRQILEHETDVVKNYGAADMSPDNYTFRYVREEELNGQRCFVLEIVPRRKDKMLLRGQIWVDATTYLPHRAEGEPGKEPSWWVRDAHVVLIYSEVGGMWLQTASESSADVRLLGRHTMVSRDVEYKMGDLAASTGGAAHPGW